MGHQAGHSTDLFFSVKTMAQEKFSAKGKKGKKHLTLQQKQDRMSHKNQRNQQWKAEKMDQAQALWKANDYLPPDQRLSMRTITKKVGIAKTTIIERLSGRRQGSGHIVGGKRKVQILTKGKQAGHQAGHINRFNHFNRTSKQVTKWVIVR